MPEDDDTTVAMAAEYRFAGNVEVTAGDAMVYIDFVQRAAPSVRAVSVGRIVMPRTAVTALIAALEGVRRPFD